MITILITQNTEATSAGKSGGSPVLQKDPHTLLMQEGMRIMGLSACAESFTPEKFERTEDGKPFIPGLPDLHFNLSHSGEYIAGAFSDREVGLDLQEESRTHISVLRIAKRFFTDIEYKTLLSLPEKNGTEPAGAEDVDNRKAAETDESDPGNTAEAGNPDNCCSVSGRLLLFHRFWSIKEAYLKYLGCGLRGKLNGFLPDPLPLDLPSKEEAQKADLLRGQIRIVHDSPLYTPAQYAIVQGPRGYAMAVCAEILPPEIRVKFI